MCVNDIERDRESVWLRCVTKREKVQKTLIQCDQMAWLFFNIWPVTSMKISPMAYKFCPSRSKIFTNSKINHQKNAQDFEDFAKMAKFRQIWSRCSNSKYVLRQLQFHNRDQYYKTDFALTQFTARFWCIIWGTRFLFVAAITAAL